MRRLNLEIMSIIDRSFVDQWTVSSVTNPVSLRACSPRDAREACCCDEAYVENASSQTSLIVPTWEFPSGNPGATLFKRTVIAICLLVDAQCSHTLLQLGFSTSALAASFPLPLKIVGSSGSSSPGKHSKQPWAPESAVMTKFIAI
jgi:hypothetical protein